jgi:hypothetical protein
VKDDLNTACHFNVVVTTIPERPQGVGEWCKVAIPRLVRTRVLGKQGGDDFTTPVECCKGETSVVSIDPCVWVQWHAVGERSFEDGQASRCYTGVPHHRIAADIAASPEKVGLKVVCQIPASAREGIVVSECEVVGDLKEDLSWK